jgi:threonine dehydratase
MSGMNLTDLKLERIERAAREIDPVFRDSPQFFDEELCQALGRRVLVKVETTNPLRSFKGRGADFLVRGLDAKKHLVCASAGNFGQAMAYAGRGRGMKVDVFAAEDVNPIKVKRMESLGAKVVLQGASFDRAKEAAREYAAQGNDRMFIEDGDQPAIAEGAGTIGIELMKAGKFDALVVPVGDGALITGVGRWLKEHAPHTRLVGVCASGAPAMLESWRSGKAVSTAKAETIADGISVRVPIGSSVERMVLLVDDMVLVEDAEMIEAMRLAIKTLGTVLEPAGAAGLAAIRKGAVAGERLATVLTGGNIRPELLSELLAEN